MWFEVHNIRTKFLRGTSDARCAWREHAWLCAYLAFPDTKARYRRGSYAGKAADDKIRLFNIITSTFPTGFLPTVRRAAEAEGYTVEILDRRVVPAELDPTADLAWLRAYQREAVDAVGERKRGIISAPTGSGKTEIAVGLTLALPCQWLFVVHRTTLTRQALDRYGLRTKLKAGFIGEGMWDVPDDATFVCATFQTLHAGMKRNDPKTMRLLTEWAQGLIVDECHTLPAQSFLQVAMLTRSAYYRVGVSGTPLDRDDNRSIYAVATLGPVIYRIKADTLIDAGVLARPSIRMVHCTQRSDKPTWQGVYGESIVRSPARNNVLIECAKVAKKPCLLFVKEISHGKHLEKMLLKAGIRCAFTWGNHSTDYRMSRVRDLVRGAIDVLVCSVVFQEGLDVPELESVIVGSGGKSVIATLQRIGRGMRVAKDKTTFEVWDVADRGCCRNNKLGQHTGCKWLEKHSQRRVRAYLTEGYQTTELASVSEHVRDDDRC